MKKLIEDRNDVVKIQPAAADASARLRLITNAMSKRLASGQHPLLTDIERDLLLIGIAQELKIIA